MLFIHTVTQPVLMAAMVFISSPALPSGVSPSTAAKSAEVSAMSGFGALSMAAPNPGGGSGATAACASSALASSALASSAPRRFARGDGRGEGLTRTRSGTASPRFTLALPVEVAVVGVADADADAGADADEAGVSRRGGSVCGRKCQMRSQRCTRLAFASLVLLSNPSASQPPPPSLLL